MSSYQLFYKGIKSTLPSDTQRYKRRRKMIVNLARLYLAGVSPLGVSFYLEPEMEKGENNIYFYYFI